MVIRRCVGLVVIGMPRWRFESPEGDVSLPTEFSQYEGALAFTLKLPMLVLVQQNVMRRGVFDDNFDGYVGVSPEKPDRSWLSTNQFSIPFGFWKQKLEERRDVFLGY